MKNLIYILLTVLLCHVNGLVSAQNNSIVSEGNELQTFAPVGAKWYYGIWISMWMNIEHYETLEVIQDTVINGKQCSVLEIRYHSEQGNIGTVTGYEYLHQEQQKVYHWDKYNQNFYLLYDFSANAGDEWKVPCYAMDSITVRVDTVNYINRNGLTLKSLCVSYIDGCSYSFGSTITEKYGSIGYLFLYDYGGSDMDIPHLRCYFDEELSMSFTDNCDYATDISVIYKEQENLVVDNKFVQLPPSLKLETDKVFIFNINGQCVLSTVPCIDGKISISSIPKGIYFVSLQKNNKNTKTFKICIL